MEHKPPEEATKQTEAPVEMNLIIAGASPVMVDAVSAAVMDVSLTEVKHLVLT